MHNITSPLLPASTSILDDLALSESDADSPIKIIKTPIKKLGIANPLSQKMLFQTPEKKLCKVLPPPISPLENTKSPPQRQKLPLTQISNEANTVGKPGVIEAAKSAIINFQTVSEFKVK